MKKDGLLVKLFKRYKRAAERVTCAEVDGSWPGVRNASSDDAWEIPDELDTARAILKQCEENMLIELRIADGERKR